MKLLLLFAALAAHAQTFEVASVKVPPPLTGDRIMINLGSYNHGTLTLTNTTLADCLRFAYGLTSNSQIAGEGWMKSKEVRYDIVAKTTPDTVRAQALKMLQELLTERFKRSNRLGSRAKWAHYVLEVGKGGAKLKPASDADPQFEPRARSVIFHSRAFRCSCWRR